jgi:nucleoside-diphosphate kinase
MNQPQKERSFVAIKPDGVQRSLIGEIIGRFERTGLKLVGLKLIMATADKCWIHYNKDEKWYQDKGEVVVKNRTAAGLPIEKPAIEYGRDIIGALVKFMTCGPIVIMVWEGNQAVNIVKKLVGGTEPTTSDVGTIRGDLTLDSYELSNLAGRAVRNLIHCSDKPEEAQREIDIWFNKEDLLSYSLVQEKILYDVNIDGLLE